jgi:hypothetical protein
MMVEILLSSLLVILALIGGVAIWFGVKMTRDSNEPARRPQMRKHASDPWNVERLPRGQRAAH